MRTIELYDNGEFTDLIYIKKSIPLEEIQDFLWKICEEKGWIINEEDFD